MPISDAAALPVVFTAAQAARAGYGPSRVASRVRSGAWRRLRRGVFCAAGDWQGAPPARRLQLLSMAAATQWAGTVVSHLSAAAVWELPLPLDLPDQPWLTAVTGSGTSARHTDDLVIEVAALPAGDVARHRRAGWPGLASTGRARTVADCLRHLPVADGVAIADAAVRAGLPRAGLVEVLDRQSSWPMASRASTALTLVDPRRESWLESWSTARLVQRGIPAPVPQACVRTPRGRFIARVDAWWPEHGVVGEADGFAKYRIGGLATPADAERALREEKAREDALRDLGLEVVRWGTADAVHLEPLVARVARTLRRGRPQGVTALITPTPTPPWW